VSGLTSAETTIQVQPTPEPPFAPVLSPLFILTKWNMSPLEILAPDPNQEVAENDMNSWSSVQPGTLQLFAEGNFAIYRAKFQPYAAIRKSGGTITFRKLRGTADVWLDGQLLGKKSKPEEDDFSLPFPPGKGSCTLSILIGTHLGQQAGLNGSVIIEATPTSGKWQAAHALAEPLFVDDTSQ
jgi:beta-galactosidase